MSGARLPRDLHPLAWWGWAIGLAAAASATWNPLVLLLLVGSAALVVALRRSDQPWAGSFRLYLWLGLAIVVVRLGFRVLFGGGGVGTVLVPLPELPLPDLAAGITLLGPITLESLLAGLYDGMRLAAIVVCVGAANSLANPKRLLRSVPAALYEVGTALVVAVTLLPQLVDSVRRVRAAQALRPAPSEAGRGRRVRGMRRLLVPVLEDALDRSLALAAGMDTRGYGRPGAASQAQRRVTGTLMVVGLCGVCAGVYGGLDSTTPAWLGLPMLGAGVAVAVAGAVVAGRRVERTRYRPDPWRWPETVVVVGGLAAAVLMRGVEAREPAIAYPPLDAVPTVSVAVLLAVVAAVGGALAAPPAAPVGSRARVVAA